MEHRVHRDRPERVARVGVPTAGPVARVQLLAARRPQVVRHRREAQSRPGRGHRQTVAAQERVWVHEPPAHAGRDSSTPSGRDHAPATAHETHDLIQLGTLEVQRGVEHRQHGRAPARIGGEVEQRRPAPLNRNPQANEDVVQGATPGGAAQERRRAQVEARLRPRATVPRPDRRGQNRDEEQDETDLNAPRHGRTRAPPGRRTRGSRARRMERRRTRERTAARRARSTTRGPIRRAAPPARTPPAFWPDGT